MVTDGLLNIVFNVVEFFFGFLPEIELNLSSGMYSTFLDIVASVAYLFPLDTLLFIFGLVAAFIVFRFFITLIRVLWDLLPFA